jgi:hypothetical protein
MRALQRIRRILSQLLHQVCRLPRAIVTALALRRQEVTLNEREVERLDRIRNPSKYLGKE